jgi:hypothetical protein
MGKLGRYGAIDRANPEAAARCDRGGELRKHHELRREMFWAGGRLVWNGFLCCERHIDKPNPQERLVILPIDPVPVKNPRPELAMTSIPTVIDDGVPTPGAVQAGQVLTVDNTGRPLLAVPEHRFSDAYNYPPGTPPTTP